MELLLTLKRRPGVPLYRVLAEAVKDTLIEKRLAQGSPLPSARVLARQYNLSVSTVIRAYEELAGQGYVVTSAKSGTCVGSYSAAKSTKSSANSNSLNPVLASTRAPELSHFAQRLVQSESLAGSPRDAGTFIPGPDLLPTTTWQRLLAKYQNCYAHEEALYDYSSDPFGHEPLRQTIADYVKRTRGIRCSLEQIVVAAAVRLDLGCRLLINSGDTVAVENPCYPGARKMFSSHGAKLFRVDADDRGLDPAPLFSSTEKFRMLYLCPSHQDPSGVSLSMERRHAILAWSQKTNTLIWENDFDCNYYYTDSPLPAIQSLKENDTVIYSGSFWLTLGPLASSGFLVLPERYIPAMRSLLSSVQSERPVLENYALAEFIRAGHLERYMHKQRNLYSKKRQALIHALTLALRRLVTFRESSGVHIVLQFDPSLTEASVLDCAAQAGLEIKSTRFYYIDDHPINEFIIPFIQVEEKAIQTIAKNFAASLLAIR